MVRFLVLGGWSGERVDGDFGFFLVEGWFIKFICGEFLSYGMGILYVWLKFYKFVCVRVCIVCVFVCV